MAGGAGFPRPSVSSCSRSAPGSSTPCGASSSPCPTPVPAKPCSSRLTPLWRPHSPNPSATTEKGQDVPAGETSLIPKIYEANPFPNPAPDPAHFGPTENTTSTHRQQAKLPSYPKSTKPTPFRTQLPDPAHFGPTENTTSTHRHSDPPSRSQIQRYKMASVESRKGAVVCTALASLRFPSPLIKPDVRISRIRLSDWLHPEAHGGGPR